jgi:hypothetical protein
LSIVIDFELKPKFSFTPYEPIRRIFYLGQTILRVDGRSPLAELSVQRSPQGTCWTLRMRMENIKKLTTLGTYGPEQIIQEVCGYGLFVTHEEWIKMGWRPSTAIKDQPCEVIELFADL